MTHFEDWKGHRLINTQLDDVGEFVGWCPVERHPYPAFEVEDEK